MAKIKYVKVEDCKLKESVMRDFNRNMDSLIGVLNHRVTKLEVSVNYIKWVIGYIAIIMTGTFVATIAPHLIGG